MLLLGSIITHHQREKINEISFKKRRKSNSEAQPLNSRITIAEPLRTIMTQTVLDYDQLQLIGRPTIKKPAITDEPRLKPNGWIALSMIALKQAAIERNPFINQPRSACLPVASSGSPVRDPAAPWSQRAGKWPSESVRHTEPGSHSPYKCGKHFDWIRWVFSLTYNLSRRSRRNSVRAEHPM